MAEQEPKNLDEYELSLTERMTPWPAGKCVAFAAGIAERWLPAYAAFSAAEDWGDPASLRRSLEAVWAHATGKRLSASDAERHVAQLEDVTPHMDDFDDEDALTACAALSDALRACRRDADALPFATRAALGVFECLDMDWPTDPAGAARVWKKQPIRKEFQAQWKLLAEIDALTSLDAAAIDALRRRSTALERKPAARDKPSGPPTVSNQTLFEMYRRMVESDIKGQVQGEPDAEPGSFLFAVSYLGYWMGRYSRRLQTINGSYGKLTDELAQKALVARNQACDRAAPGTPAWGSEMQEALEMFMQNNSRMGVIDVASAEAPHGYGPSLRRLWLEGSRQASTAKAPWQYVRQWASHRPAAWELEDRRKKRGLALATPELGQYVGRQTSWASTLDPWQPWSTEVEGIPWRVRLNDFPDELMYSLLMGDTLVGDFHDWPETWQRS